MNWNDVRVFLAAMRTCSASAAGRRLGIDPVTVGRRLETLESALGVSLFLRGPRGLAPTEAANAILPAAERIESAALAIERIASGRQQHLAGPVRLACPADLAEYVIAPALPALQRVHPDIELSLRTGGEILDLDRRQADISLRLVRPQANELVCRRLGVIEFAAYGTAERLSDRWIGWDEALLTQADAAWLETQCDDRGPVLRVNRTAIAVAAARAGVGRALLPRLLAKRHPELLLLDVAVPPHLQRSLWLVVHQDIRRVPRIRAVSDFISARCADILVPARANESR